MAFQSLTFLLFLCILLAVCLTAGRRNVRAGKLLLLAGCAVFYLWALPRPAVLGGFLVLLGGTAATWAAAEDFQRHPTRKRAVLTAVLCWLIGSLLFFKYAGFLSGGRFSAAAPLGLSFFTFQQIWYLKEVYTGAFLPQKREDSLLYAFFFPTVSSGPILKPQNFFPQLSGEHFLHPDWQDAAAGLYAIGIGMGKKVLLADSFGVIVSNGWANPAALTAPEAWMVMLGYTLQLYFDFSGYCDIAAGAARLLGIRLPQNFDSPYRALSVGEFWKRWHITLTSFLRECLYFPLGGSRRGTARTYLNILIVFLVSGMWHGAGWTFLVWGGLHGLAQIAERAWGKDRDRLPVLARWAVTFVFVNLAWVFFRAPSLSSAFTLLKSAAVGGTAMPGEWLLEGLFTSEMDAVRMLLPALAPVRYRLLGAGLYGAGLLAALLPGNTIRRMDTFRPTLLRGAAVLAIFTWSILSFGGGTTFLYTNF